MVASGNSSSSSAVQSDENHIDAYQVVPLSTCPHLDTVKSFRTFDVDVKQECPKCTSEEDRKKKENWICLTCHEVNYSNEKTFKPKMLLL